MKNDSFYDFTAKSVASGNFFKFSLSVVVVRTKNRRRRSEGFEYANVAAIIAHILKK